MTTQWWKSSRSVKLALTYVRFIGANSETRVTFADDEIGTKERTLGFSWITGQAAAIASDASHRC